MDADLDTLATALYVKIDDELKASPQLNRWRPAVGIAPKITDAELITLAVLQSLLSYHKEARWIRYAREPAPPVSPPAQTARIQQATTGPDLADHPLHPAADLGHRPVAAPRAHRRLHPGGVRTLPRDRQTL